MRIFFTYVVCIASIGFGCTPISELEPNQTETFLKFYSETNVMESKDLAVLEDGYLILSTYSATATVLLKTDLNGNKLWAQSFANFQGNSLAVLTDGYILIGDGINDQMDTTKMQLIRTNANGDSLTNTAIGNAFYHGSTVMQSSNGDIIGLGYSNKPGADGYIVAMGFNSDLSDSTWDSERNYFAAGKNRTPSKSMFETNEGNLLWLTYSEELNTFSGLSFASVPPDRDSDDNGSPVLNGYEFSNTKGDFIKISTGYTTVQTVVDNGKNKISISDGLNENVLNENEFATYNFTGSAITNSKNGLLIAASTDRHPGTTRTDEDLLLLEVNYNGTVKSSGINITYGGIGDEIPVRIRKSKDGGYVVLGTLINSKGAQQSFLLKTNSKGLLD